MNYRDAVDGLCKGISHARLAKELGVSLPSMRQARMRPDSAGYRRPPVGWRKTVIRLAEKRVADYQELIRKIDGDLRQPLGDDG